MTTTVYNNIEGNETMTQNATSGTSMEQREERGGCFGVFSAMMIAAVLLLLW